MFSPLTPAALLLLLRRKPELFSSLPPLWRDRKLAPYIRILRWLIGLGLVAEVNSFLTRVALNNWRLRSPPKWHLDREVAVITGGSDGIGKQVVERLLAKGTKVAILDVQSPPAQILDNPSILYIQCDVTDPSALNAAADQVRSKFGRSPSILINNVGIAVGHTILDTEPAWLQKLFAVNVLSHFYAVRAFLPDMIRERRGHVVFTASMASFFTGAELVDYAATKAAVMALWEGLRGELKHRYNAPEIMTSVIHPTYVQTKLSEGYWKSVQSSKTFQLQPGDVADVIVEQLASGTSGRRLLPELLHAVSGFRGWPLWAQEAMRDDIAKQVDVAQT